MIRLSRTELKELAQILVLANTPRSLYGGLVNSAGMTKLRACSTADLLDYYNQITARARRSEFVIALSYAVLCAILLHAREGERIAVDASRLDWGENIADYLKSSTVPTRQIVINPSQRKPAIRIEGSGVAPASPTGQLVNLHGRPWRDRND
jgi:hypothetical protein